MSLLFNNGHWKTLLTCFVCNGVSSVVMMLSNKQLSIIFPFPFMTIFLQNAIVFLLSGTILYSGILGSDAQARPFRKEHFLACIPVGISTSMVLSTSIVALRYSPLPLIVTFRNLTPIVTALLECVYLGNAFSRSSKIGLVCGVCGGILYTIYDPPRQSVVTSHPGYTEVDSFLFSSQLGVFFVVVNLILSAAVIIFETNIIKKLKTEQPPAAVNCLRILVMTPILVVFSLMFEDQAQWQELVFAGIGSGSGSGSISGISAAEEGLAEKKVLQYLVLTGVFATIFGISGLTINQCGVRPTTMAFANTMYKLITTVVGRFLFPVPVPFLAWCGYLLSFIGFLVYTSGKESHFRPKSPPASPPGSPKILNKKKDN